MVPTNRLIAVRGHHPAVFIEALSSGRAMIPKVRQSVPDELSVVGFGDELGFRLCGPGLTTVGLPVSELATACGLWFVHQLKQGSANRAPYSSVSSSVLIVRGSTRPIGSHVATEVSMPELRPSQLQG